MADEKDLALPGEAGDAGKRSPVAQFLKVALILAALAAGGYFSYVYFLNPAPMSKSPAPVMDAASPPDAKKDPVLSVMVSMDPFIVNLARSKGKRFLKVNLTLELNSPEVHAEVNDNRQKIVDSILVLLSSKTFEDVYSVQGKFKLKDEITTRVNRFLVLGHVKEVYFTEFVIQ
ncbi:MAG: flagellar basal body-associated FliL family protein [Nitrospinae bacterium]|nr:flagellar basal body-associated FliL family protein [Nitrospinota bacterium]